MDLSITLSVLLFSSDHTRLGRKDRTTSTGVKEGDLPDTHWDWTIFLVVDVSTFFMEVSGLGFVMLPAVKTIPHLSP